MSLESDALPAGPVIERTTTENTALAAAKALADARAKEFESLNPAPEAPSPSEATPPEPEKSAEEADAAPPQEATGEAEASDPVPEERPLDRPRSWSKDRQEAWAKLDRETQEYLLSHDREASANIRKAQNEAAERTKAITAKETAAEQARAQYEQALPLLLEAIQNDQQGQFADIKSIADVEKLAQEDWPRFALWQAHQMKIQAVKEQMIQATHRQEQEKQTKWQSFAREQDALFREKAPDLADADAMSKAANAAVGMLKDVGFSDDELGRMWNGQGDLSLRDHRVQLLIRDGVRYREAQAAAKKVTAVPKPPVQRPGAATSKATSIDAQIQALTKQMAGASSTQQARIAAQIVSLRREAARRS
jgi:hypothetical protein